MSGRFSQARPIRCCPAHTNCARRLSRATRRAGQRGSTARTGSVPESSREGGFEETENTLGVHHVHRAIGYGGSDLTVEFGVKQHPAWIGAHDRILEELDQLRRQGEPVRVPRPDDQGRDEPGGNRLPTRRRLEREYLLPDGRTGNLFIEGEHIVLSRSRSHLLDKRPVGEQVEDRRQGEGSGRSRSTTRSRSWWRSSSTSCSTRTGKSEVRCQAKASKRRQADAAVPDLHRFPVRLEQFDVPRCRVSKSRL